MEADKKRVSPLQVDDSLSEDSGDLSSTLTNMSLERLLKPFAGNEKFYRRLINIFETNLVKQLSDIELLISQHNIPELLMRVHTLKGTSGSTGLPSLYHALYDWEITLAQHDVNDTDNDHHHYADLGQHIAAIARAELATIHALLATSTPETAMTAAKHLPNGHSSTELVQHIDELKQQLQQGNLNALERCQQLHVMLCDNKTCEQEITALCNAVEMLDFEHALQILNAVSQKLT